ncbi:hypothetical protein NAT51_19235 [Flavobacterium amniphilum]|uniref:hypothetical protein n=1 Tax=Flavobacterium amniphilum TaxID=1834035 RepID=UPI002029CA42|nr:hypothetical protein [Flavobacterium amniphilum]MCL9807665.1 hypothetical protein [Flavobacterium amniphilum]
MPQYIESYYLVNNRESKLILNFIGNHTIVKKETTDEYPVPQYSNFTERTFTSDKELLIFLEENQNYEYDIYWQNENEESIIRQFSVHFTDDGKMIIGVAIEGNELNSKNSVELFNEIKNYLSSSIACITSEEPPPNNSIEFANFCNERFIPL